MLLPEQLDTSADLPTFFLSVESLKVCGRDTGPIKIPVSYDGNWRPVFHLGKILPTELVAKICFSDEYSVSFTLKGRKDSVRLLLSKCTFGSQFDETVVEAILQREPLVIEHSALAKRFQAVLLSTPKFVGKSIVLRDSKSVEFEIKFSKQSSAGLGYISSNVLLAADNPLTPLSDLVDFLTFMKGSYSGLGNLTAYDENEAIAFQLLGFTKNDFANRQRNWFDIEIQRDLPSIFLMFSTAMIDATTKRALRQAISFYRASNSSRDVSMEMSIIAAHSGLEAIVNYILSNRAGWSKRLVDERSITFSDKIRAAFAHFSLRDDVLVHSPNLIELAQARNNMDAFELISFIRNKLVHQDLKFVPTGRQLHETWLVAQWLLEVLIFSVIGYRGEIVDRRIYLGGRGRTCLVPFRS